MSVKNPLISDEYEMILNNDPSRSAPNESIFIDVTSDNDYANNVYTNDYIANQSNDYISNIQNSNNNQDNHENQDNQNNYNNSESSNDSSSKTDTGNKLSNFNTLDSKVQLTLEDHVLLKELENKNNNLNINKSLERKYSINEYMNPIDAFSNSKFDLTVTTTNGSKLTISEQTLSVLDMILPKIKQRIKTYTIIVLLLSFACISIINTSTGKWYIFVLCSLLIELACSIMNFLLFHLIDYVLLDYYELAYCLHAFNGPIGWIIAIIIINKTNFEIPQSIDMWNQFINALLVILLFLCIKQWFERKYYTNLLEKRFSDRLLLLDSWVIILSELSCAKPPKTALIRQRTSGINSHFHNETSHTNIKKITNVFVDLVDSTFVDNLNIDDDINNTTDLSVNKFNRLKLLNAVDFDNYLKNLKKKTFWHIAARINKLGGALSLLTYNGTVVIRRRKQAKIFARCLYTHLSKGNKVAITNDLIKQLLSNKTYKANPLYPDDFASLHVMYSKNIRQRSNSYTVQSNDNISNLLYESTMKLLDPNGTNFVTETQLIMALYQVYKEQRYVYTSLEHSSELHISLKRVLDIIFWFFMLVVLQAFLQINISNMILPFVTMILTVSFALAPLVGNMFLSITFVFFMMPYDIGHKVAFGASTDTRITGFIKNISLLYTTVSNTANETVRIPNHILFSEKIYNYFESGGTSYEITLTFNSLDSLLWDQGKIDLFMQDVKTYVSKEKKNEWESIFIACVDINNRNNTIIYKLWVTHKESFQNWAATTNSKTNLIQYIKILYNERFQKLKVVHRIDDETNSGVIQNLPNFTPGYFNTTPKNSPKVCNLKTRSYDGVYPNTNTNKIM